MQLELQLAAESNLYGTGENALKRRLQREWIAAGADTRGEKWEAFRKFTADLGRKVSDKHAHACDWDYNIYKEKDYIPEQGDQRNGSITNKRD